LIRILASILDKNILCCSGCYFSSIIEYKGDASILMNNRPFDHDCPNGIIPGIAFFITKEARLYGRCTLLVIPKSFSFVQNKLSERSEEPILKSIKRSSNGFGK